MTGEAKTCLAGRDKLKLAFSEGELVTSSDFDRLIHSVYNLNTEGFHRSAAFGFEASSEGDSRALMRFWRGFAGEDQPAQEPAAGHGCNSDFGTPLWTVRFGDVDDSDLVIAPTAVPSAVIEAGAERRAHDPTASRNIGLTLKRSGRVGINRPRPTCEVDVDDTLRSAGRLGVSRAATDKIDADDVVAYADGNWHSITPPMTGCQTLEVMAGVGKRGSGRYALVRAIAVNAYNPIGWTFNFLRLKNRIRCQHAWYRSRLDKFRLRWHGTNRRYTLQIRTNSDYGVTTAGEPVPIRYHVTSLWNDPRMLQSRLSGASES